MNYNSNGFKAMYQENFIDVDFINVENLDISSLSVDTIVGKTNINQLSLLGSTINNTNTIYLSTLNQNVGNESSPTFGSIYIYDINSDNTYQILSQVNLSANRLCYLPLLTADDSFVFAEFAQTLTNKTIDSDLNTITNIVDADIKTGANIDFDKLQYHKNSGTTNYGIGSGALANITSGTDNIAIGLSAGTAITTASESVIIGTNALSALQTATALQSVIIGTNVGEGKANSGSVQSVVIGWQPAGLGFGNLSTIIGWRAGGGNSNQVSNTVIGYNCFYQAGTGGHVDSDRNVFVGAGILRQATTTGVKADNMCFGTGIFDAMTSGTALKNTLFGVEVLKGLTTSTNSNNIIGGYQCLSNLTTGSINNSTVIGDLITANAITNILSNICVIGARNIALRPIPLTNYVQIGDSTKTELYIPITSLNTDGVLKTASNIISSALLVNADVSATANIDITKLGTGIIDNTEFNFLNGLNQNLTTTSGVVFDQVDATNGVFTNIIDEYSANSGVTIDNLLIKDNNLQLTEQANSIGTIATKLNIWAKNTTPNTLWITDDSQNDHQIADLNSVQVFSNKSFSDSIAVDTINEYTATNGVSVDGVKLKDSNLQLTETSGNPIAVDATKATIWVRNDTNQSFMMTDDQQADICIYGSKGGIQFYYTTGTSQQIITGMPNLFVASNNYALMGGNRGITLKQGIIKTITSVTDSGVGGIARFNHSSDADYASRGDYVSLVGFTNYTNGIYLITSRSTTYIQTSLLYSVNDTGSAYTGDEITVLNGGTYNIRFNVSASVNNASQIFDIGLVKNGTSTLYTRKNTSTTPAKIGNAHFDIYLTLSANDKLAVDFRCNATHTITYYSSQLTIN